MAASSSALQEEVKRLQAERQALLENGKMLKSALRKVCYKFAAWGEGITGISLLRASVVTCLTCCAHLADRCLSVDVPVLGYVCRIQRGTP